VSFAQVWLSVYYNPARAVEGLKHKPAPQWGLYGVLIRCLVVSLLWYLPAYLLGRTPSSAPSLVGVSAENYYAALIVIFPAFTLATWLLHGALSHLILRLSGREGGIDQVLNIDGVGNLIVGVPLVAFDWIALALLGWQSATVGWGLIHLLIDAFYVVFVVIGLRNILGVPLWFAAALVVLWHVVDIPLAMLFLRP
jgi:hypothetical protein